MGAVAAARIRGQLVDLHRPARALTGLKPEPAAIVSNAHDGVFAGGGEGPV